MGKVSVIEERSITLRFFFSLFSPFKKEDGHPSSSVKN